MTLLNHWKHKEDRLAGIRKTLCDRGVTSEAAIADTWVDQQRNNKSYDRIMSKGQFRRTVSSFA